MHSLLMHEFSNYFVEPKQTTLLRSYQRHLTGEKTKAQKNKHFTQIQSQCHSRSVPLLVHQRVTCELRLCSSHHFALHPALHTELGT